VRSAFALLDPKAGDEKAVCVIKYEYEMCPLRETENEISHRICDARSGVSAYLWYKGCYEYFCFFIRVGVFYKQIKKH